MVRVSLFITCLADTLFPDAGVAMVRLLRHLGVEVDFPAEQTCCGQSLWNSGYPDEATRLARHFLNTFEESEYIVSPSGSCPGMIHYYYPEMFKDQPRELERARSVASRTYEFTQFLVEVLGAEDIGATYNGVVTYHNGCHMTRELGVVDPPRRLLQKVRGLELVEMERQDLCCGFGGTFAVKQPEISVAMADEKLHHAAATGAQVLVSADAACLMHLGGRAQRQGLNLQIKHIAELLAEGVGLL